ncbi:MAG TPA: VOC family protein [Terriglobales bacterium]|nr:VOC family protein [Terriglobales bacterium]
MESVKFRSMRLDHVAHTCRDPHTAHRFYQDMLGLKLVQAYCGRDLMLVYDLPGGGSLAFTTSAGTAPVIASEASWERQHVGLTVNTRQEFGSWLQRLQESGIKYQLVENERIYFSDPDGLVLEIEVASPTAPNPNAAEVLARWEK